MNNVEGTPTSSEDGSLPSQLCELLNGETDNLCPSPNIDCISEPMNELESNDNIDKIRQYLQTQCYEGFKWYHSLTFETTTDKKILQYRYDPICQQLLLQRQKRSEVL